MNLKNMSSQELRELAKKANQLADDLKKEEPSYTLALENGIKDISYNTTANGYVSSYKGTATITMENGSTWKAIGHRPKGDAWSIYRQGYIEFTKIESAK